MKPENQRVSKTLPTYEKPFVPETVSEVIRETGDFKVRISPRAKRMANEKGVNYQRFQDQDQTEESFPVI